MGDGSGELLERLVQSANGPEKIDKLTLIERLFAALPVESQERLLRELLLASEKRATSTEGTSPRPARRPPGPMAQRNLRFRAIGPWQMCCRMMADIDQAPSVEDVDPGLPAEVFGALGDETRLKIIRLLQDDERPFEEIARILGVPRSTLSHHLRVLREAGLVEVERRGRSSFYSLAQPREDLADP